MAPTGGTKIASSRAGREVTMESRQAGGSGFALNWLLQRPSVAKSSSERNEEQLRQNLGAVGWNLTPAHVARLDAASATTPVYPTGTSGNSRSGIGGPP